MNTTQTQAAAAPAAKPARKMNPQNRLDKWAAAAMEQGGAFVYEGGGLWAFELPGYGVVCLKSSDLYDLRTFEDLIAFAATRRNHQEEQQA